MQRALAQRDRELVVGPREMIEPDVDVAGRREFLVRDREHREFRLRIGQLLAVVEDFLRRLDPRHVRVAENRQPVGRQRQHVLDRLRKRLRRLQRQTEDQVDVDRAESARAQPVEGLLVDRLRLKPVDRQLHPRVRVLHAERRAVGPDLLQRPHVVLGEPARIDLDAELAVRRAHRKDFSDQCSEPAQFVRREKGRRAAAQMDLRDRPRAIHPRGGEPHLPREIVEILGGGIAALGDDGVAAAEPAPRLAKREVKIQRDRTRAGRVVLLDRLDHPRTVEIDGELRRRRIRRVARSGHRVFANEIQVERRDAQRGRFEGGDHGGRVCGPSVAHLAPMGCAPLAAHRALFADVGGHSLKVGACRQAISTQWGSPREPRDGPRLPAGSWLQTALGCATAAAARDFRSSRSSASSSSAGT